MKQTIRLTPLAWDLADKHSLSLEELASVSGTGEEGRITDEDLRQYLASRGRVTVPTGGGPTQPLDVDAAVAHERRRHKKRWLIAVGIWVLWFLALLAGRLLAEAPSDSSQGAAGLLGLALLGGLCYGVVRLAVLQGRKWYEVFGLIVPIVNLILVGRVFWHLAGMAVGAKPEVFRTASLAPLAEEDARKKLAEQAAEAVRAADERAPH